MIGNSSLKVCMIQEIYVFSIKYVQLKLVSYMYQIQRYENYDLQQFLKSIHGTTCVQYQTCSTEICSILVSISSAPEPK